VAIEPANELRGVKPVSSVESLHWLCCMDRRQISTQAQTVSDNLRQSQTISDILRLTLSCPLFFQKSKSSAQ
jgi:hypothetical protein